MVEGKSKEMKKTIQIIGAALVMAFFIWIGMQIERKMQVEPYKVIDKTHTTVTR